MKRILISIAAVAGVGGLIALMSYHPKNDAAGSSADGLTQPSPSGGVLSANTPAPDSPTPTPAGGSGGSGNSGGGYRNGTYTGSTVDVGYGPVQVAVVISGGKLTGVNFLQMPSDAARSVMIARQATPILQQEAVSAQSANVDLVTGATSDWEGFVKSLQSALNQAKA